jgi:Flp pilus assembly pilin Flp
MKLILEIKEDRHSQQSLVRAVRPTGGSQSVQQFRETMSMTKLLAKLWSDDCGALIAAEYLFVATILVIGIIVGLSNVRDAINTELSELANAYLALSQGYTISGQSGCCAETQGSQALDLPALVPDPVCVPNFILSDINAFPCN